MAEQLLSIDLSQYDFTNMTNDEIQVLIAEVNTEVKQILLDAQAEFYSAYQTEYAKAEATVKDLTKEVNSLSASLGDGVKEVQEIQEVFETQMYIQTSILVCVGLLVGMAVGFFVSSFMRKKG